MFDPLNEPSWISQVLLLECRYLALVFHLSGFGPRQFTAHEVAEHEY